MDNGAWIGIKNAALYLQARFDNTNLVHSLLSPLIMKFVPFVAEYLFDPAVSHNGTEIQEVRDWGIKNKQFTANS